MQNKLEQSYDEEAGYPFCENCGCKITVGRCKHGVQAPLLVINKYSNFRHKGEAMNKTNTKQAGERTQETPEAFSEKCREGQQANRDYSKFHQALECEFQRLERQRDELNLELIEARLERGQLRKERDELLAACKAALEALGGSSNSVMLQLRAAIAAAEGRAQ